MKMSVVVPYRDREQNLRLLVPHLKNFLGDKYDYSITVIEQEDGKPFNKGRLLNLGFHLTKDDADYFCFHDVDLLPMNNTCDYSFPTQPTHLSVFVSQFNFVRRAEELGGVFLLSKKDYEHVNGHSNGYWGWGLEDNDMALRCIRRDLRIDRRGGHFMSLPHPPLGDTMNPGNTSEATEKNRKRFASFVSGDADIFAEGLVDFDFQIKHREELEEHVTKYTVGF